MKRKVLAVITIFVMLIGMMAGCGSAEEDTVRGMESTGESETEETLVEKTPTEAYPQVKLLTRVLFYYPDAEDTRDEDVYLEYEYDECGNMLTNVLYDSTGNVFYDEMWETHIASYKYEYTESPL